MALLQRPAALQRGGGSAQQQQLASHSMLHRQICPALGGRAAGWHRGDAVAAAAARSKGFGTTTPRKQDDTDGSSNKARMRKVRKPMSQSMPGQEQREEQQGQAFQQAVAVQQRVVDERENAEFAARLQALKAQGEEKRKELPAAAATAAGASGSRGTTTSPTTGGTAAFDQPAESIYDNPPSLQDTVLSSLNQDISDPKLKNADIGPSQIAIAASAVIFGLVFVLVAGSDFTPSTRFKGVRSALEPPDSVQQGIIKTRISQLEEQLRVTPNDPESTQALALSYAQLLQFDKAADLLDKLAAKQPNLPDAWRLLGETSLLGEQAGRAVKAYERAITLRDDDLQIATGLVDAYIANGQQAKAVDYINQLKTKLNSPAGDSAATSTSSAAPVAAAGSGDGASTSAAADGAATGEPSTSGSTSTSSSRGSGKQRSTSRAIRPLEPVALDLLLAKTYSQWRGHDSDAIATYDALIAAFPEDFRGYLAKGVFLRDKGRRADAERMFLQARFYAPENRQRFIKDTVDATPVVQLPDNN